MRDEFSNMTDSEAIWYSRGYELAKSEGWSVSQKEAIDFELRCFASNIYGITRLVLEGVMTQQQYQKEKIWQVKYCMTELEAITKGSEQ